MTLSLATNGTASKHGLPIPGIRRILSRAKSSLGIVYNRLEALLFDLRHGTDTRGKIPADEMGISGEGAQHATGYQAVNEAHFASVINNYAFPPGSTFVDVGSGKGKALLLASRNKSIARAMGIEIAESLCQIAERNIATFERTRGAGARISVIAADAIASPIDADQNIIYLFNPFDESFLKLFLDKLDESLREHPRQIWLLYVNPRFRALITDHFHYTLLREHQFFGPGRNIAVYSKGP